MYRKVQIVFSMDGIKNMDQLYTWPMEHDEFIGGEVEVEHYHGEDYCKSIVASLTDWSDAKYIGSHDRLANETFTLTDNGVDYTLSFAIDTYAHKIAHMEVTIKAPDTENYDQRLEKLKIALKDKLLPDWRNAHGFWMSSQQRSARKSTSRHISLKTSFVPLQAKC